MGRIITNHHRVCRLRACISCSRETNMSNSLTDHKGSRWLGHHHFHSTDGNSTSQTCLLKAAWGSGTRFQPGCPCSAQHGLSSVFPVSVSLTSFFLPFCPLSLTFCQGFLEASSSALGKVDGQQRLTTLSEFQDILALSSQAKRLPSSLGASCLISGNEGTFYISVILK